MTVITVYVRGVGGISTYFNEWFLRFILLRVFLIIYNKIFLIHFNSLLKHCISQTGMDPKLQIGG